MQILFKIQQLSFVSSCIKSIKLIGMDDDKNWCCSLQKKKKILFSKKSWQEFFPEVYLDLTNLDKLCTLENMRKHYGAVLVFSKHYWVSAYSYKSGAKHLLFWRKKRQRKNLPSKLSENAFIFLLCLICKRKMQAQARFIM